MQHHKRILSAVFLTVFSATANAGFFLVEARSLGMGNARVATADIATAPFANPGMLAYQPSREDFSLVLGAGGFLMDADGVVNTGAAISGLATSTPRTRRPRAIKS